MSKYFYGAMALFILASCEFSVKHPYPSVSVDDMNSYFFNLGDEDVKVYKYKVEEVNMLSGLGGKSKKGNGARKPDVFNYIIYRRVDSVTRSMASYTNDFHCSDSAIIDLRDDGIYIKSYWVGDKYHDLEGSQLGVSQIFMNKSKTGDQVSHFIDYANCFAPKKGLISEERTLRFVGQNILKDKFYGSDEYVSFQLSIDYSYDPSVSKHGVNGVSGRVHYLKGVGFYGGTIPTDKSVIMRTTELVEILTYEDWLGLIN